MAKGSYWGTEELRNPPLSSHLSMHSPNEMEGRRLESLDSLPWQSGKESVKDRLTLGSPSLLGQQWETYCSLPFIYVGPQTREPATPLLCPPPAKSQSHTKPLESGEEPTPTREDWAQRPPTSAALRCSSSFPRIRTSTPRQRRDRPRPCNMLSQTTRKSCARMPTEALGASARTGAGLCRGKWAHPGSSHISLKGELGAEPLCHLTTPKGEESPKHGWLKDEPSISPELRWRFAQQRPPSSGFNPTHLLDLLPPRWLPCFCLGVADFPHHPHHIGAQAEGCRVLQQLCMHLQQAIGITGCRKAPQSGLLSSRAQLSIFLYKPTTALRGGQRQLVGQRS